MDLSHVTTLVGNIAATAKTLCSSNDNSNDRIHAQQQMHVLATQLSRATADPAEVATKLMFQVTMPNPNPFQTKPPKTPHSPFVT